MASTTIIIPRISLSEIFSSYTMQKIKDTKNIVKEVNEIATAGDKSAAAEFFKSAQAELRKLAKTGVIKLNTAARRTARLASQVNGLK